MFRSQLVKIIDLHHRKKQLNQPKQLIIEDNYISDLSASGNNIAGNTSLIPSGTENSLLSADNTLREIRNSMASLNSTMSVLNDLYFHHYHSTRVSDNNIAGNTSLIPSVTENFLLSVNTNLQEILDSITSLNSAFKTQNETRFQDLLLYDSTQSNVAANPLSSGLINNSNTVNNGSHLHLSVARNPSVGIISEPRAQARSYDIFIGPSMTEITKVTQQDSITAQDHSPLTAQLEDAVNTINNSNQLANLEEVLLWAQQNSLSVTSSTIIGSVFLG